MQPLDTNWGFADHVSPGTPFPGAPSGTPFLGGPFGVAPSKYVVPAKV